MSTFLWITLAVLYLTALVRKGHTALFWLGILFPFTWIVGAVMAPTPAVAAADARARLQ